MKSSIIIPTAGRPIAIKGAVQSLLANNLDKYDVEIIVVDNNISEELSANLFAFCDSLSGKVNYVREKSIGLSAARHRGAAEAKGEILTFIDDDVEVSMTWLPSIQKAFSNPNVVLVGGPSIPKFTSSIPAWFWNYVIPTQYGGWMCGWLSLIDIGHDVSDYNPNLIWGLNFSIRKSIMYKVGGFHTDSVPIEYQRWQGDGESGLTKKVKDAGYKAEYRQDALLFHLCGSDRLNSEYFIKRAYFQGVSDSYSQIRAGRLPSLQKSYEKALIYDRIRKTAGRIYRRLQGRGSVWSLEGVAEKKLTNKAYMDGWLYHQREVASDHELLKWVKLKNYINTDIRNLKTNL